ncbi:MAG: CoA ester lyase [Rhizobiaceae bacterium]
MRSLLFVPGDSQRKMESALKSVADVLILDLEDSVAPARKAEARRLTAEFIAAKGAERQLMVRINPLQGGLADDDLDGVMASCPAAIMLPKAQSSADAMALSARLRVHEARHGIADGATRILPIITETALAVLNAATWNAPQPRLCGLTWGAEDLSADIGASEARDANGALTGVFHLARSLTLLAAAACNVAAIDTVLPDFSTPGRLDDECRAALRDGFSGKMAIHPKQVDAINAAFTPSQASLEKARTIVAAFAAQPEAGVLAIGGVMHDLPHLRQAERVLAMANSLQTLQR